ncbi:SDR family oxidoreductase [Paenibacillus hexagrammi]|uniref:SDR family oxidoreductase n=1 Tax=Paenibacillus hexagrammi TaxID=2908839 RepID=A0ABY3SFU5_9BACL|nr:SDR family oxidoreductase [Paenibacillus sp. YPD9-1]UJF32903.1 SDR family oxidoreductase [Paenibacillus sp. YPD9-1]
MTRTACVTGADRGVGLELTRELLRQGYTVYAGYIIEDGKELPLLAAEYPGHLHRVPMNVADDGSVKAGAAHIASLTERLDLLINNAAILGDIQAAVTDELDFGNMQQVFNVNALGALRVSNALIHLIQRSNLPLIVNISSEAGSVGTCWRTGWFAYCMSKAALNMQTAIIHNQLKQDGGQVIAIHPGWVQTYMQGTKDEQATLTPQQSAVSILRTIAMYASDVPEQARFVDYEGNAMQW